MVVGASVQLTATALSASGTPITGKTATWVSSNPAVAAVAADGVVTALMPGSANVTATIDGKTGSAGVDVAVPLAASVTVSPPSATLDLGQSVALTAVVRDAGGNTIPGKTVTWASSSVATATVSPQGTATAVAEGTAQITATVDGVSGAAAITVRIAVASVTVTPPTASLLVGQTLQLTATPQSAAGAPLPDRSVAWSTSNAVIATVSAAGLVTAHAAGAASISATSEGKTGSATITVTAVPVASVTVEPATFTLLAGGSIQLVATPKDSAGNPLTGRTVTWASANPAIASVSTSGRVTALTAGQALITATSEGKSGSSTITVLAAPVAYVSVVPSSATMLIGQSLQMTAVLRNSVGDTLTGRTVTWSSKLPSVATVTSGGLVTALAAGITTITAQSEGKSGSADITVLLVPPASVTVLPANSTIVAGDILLLVAVSRDGSGTVLPGRTAVWTEASGYVVHGYASNDTAVVTGISAGTDTVTATVNGTSGLAQVRVTSNPANICSQIAGASVMANDGTYLGRLTSSSDAESIYNPYGAYGSQTSALSIYNRNGVYGSPYSLKSPWNPYTSTPPTLVKNSATLASFTLNWLLSSRVSPSYAESCTF
jgi:uncharacterized protein YjdB